MTHKVLLLSGKQECLVDAEDFPLLSRHKWTLTMEGYARTSCGDHFLYMHRLIMAPTGSLYVDHLNHNRLDNRKINLKLVTNSENQMNRRNSIRGGVTFHKLSGKWRARITKGQKEIHLGLFPTREEAQLVRDEAFQNWRNL